MRFLTQSRGFTLIEMLMALVMLGLALLALAGLMVGTTKNNSFGGHMAEAVIFAQDKFEEFRVISGDTMLSGCDEKIGSGGINFQRNWNVAISPDDNSRIITLNVTWADENIHSIRFENCFPKGETKIKNRFSME